jgi:hypothetical protein
LQFYTWTRLLDLIGHIKPLYLYHTILLAVAGMQAVIAQGSKSCCSNKA